MDNQAMTDTEEFDDGLVWGFMSGDAFIPLPKTPMLLAQLGPPPFDVTMPSGQVRHVIHAPETPDGRT